MLLSMLQLRNIHIVAGIDSLSALLKVLINDFLETHWHGGYTLRLTFAIFALIQNRGWLRTAYRYRNWFENALFEIVLLQLADWACRLDRLLRLN